MQGFAVNLPSLLFAKAKDWQRGPETRVLLVEINSQALFQVPTPWPKAGSEFGARVS